MKLENDGEVVGNDIAAIDGSRTLWRLSFDELNRRLRNRLLLQHVAARPEEAAVLAAMLSASLSREALDAGKAEESHAMAAEAVADAVAALPAGRYPAAPPKAKVPRVLRSIAAADPGLVDSVSSDGPQGPLYSLHLDQALDRARNLQLQAVVSGRFGIHALRVWNMLLLEGQLEQKQVADRAMVKREEARKLLYAMLKAGYLTLQEVPKTNERTPSKTLYTWRASNQQATAQLATELYRAAGNLRSRIDAQVAANADLCANIELVSRGMMAVAQLDQAELAKFTRAVDLLEDGLLRLDEQIALFNDM
jgi:DNA-directed RNA polymerase III subunit RPC3